MRRTLAHVKKFIRRLREKIKRRNASNNGDQEYPCACVLNVADIRNAESIIIKFHQRRYFKNETSILIRVRNGKKVSLAR